MLDLYVEMQEMRKTLNLAIEELKKRGQKKATAERDYRVALAKEILLQRADGVPVTIIADICRGKKEIADLKLKRDIAETLYETCLQKIYATKLEMSIVENQMQAERKGE